MNNNLLNQLNPIYKTRNIKLNKINLTYFKFVLKTYYNFIIDYIEYLPKNIVTFNSINEFNLNKNNILFSTKFKIKLFNLKTVFNNNIFKDICNLYFEKKLSLYFDSSTNNNNIYLLELLKESLFNYSNKKNYKFIFNNFNYYNYNNYDDKDDTIVFIPVNNKKVFYNFETYNLIDDISLNYFNYIYDDTFYDNNYLMMKLNKNDNDYINIIKSFDLNLLFNNKLFITDTNLIFEYLFDQKKIFNSSSSSTYIYNNNLINNTKIRYNKLDVYESYDIINDIIYNDINDIQNTIKLLNFKNINYNIINNNNFLNNYIYSYLNSKIINNNNNYELYNFIYNNDNFMNINTNTNKYYYLNYFFLFLFHYLIFFL